MLEEFTEYSNNIKEEIGIQPEQQDGTRIKKKNKDSTSLWDISKCTNIWITGMAEREEKEQEIKNLLEKMMKETSPIWQRK